MIEAHLEKSTRRGEICADVVSGKGSGAEERSWRTVDSGRAENICFAVAEMRRAIHFPKRLRKKFVIAVNGYFFFFGSDRAESNAFRVCLCFFCEKKQGIKQGKDLEHQHEKHGI